VTAIQLDVKIEGLTMQMVEETMKKAETGYLAVIEGMKEVIAEPAAQISQFAPLLEMIQIDVDQIGTVIGPSGKTIKKICADTGAEVDIDEDGKVYVSGVDHEGVYKAKSIIRAMTTEVKTGDEFKGSVVRIMPFGAFIELVPGRDGLLHISNVAEHRIDRVEDVLNIGDTVPVKVREVDEQGKINLLRTDIAPPPPRRDDRGGGRDRGGDRGGNRGGRDRDDRGGRRDRR
jgi:polyribonucleotide nucleotidyltransferase